MARSIARIVLAAVGICLAATAFAKPEIPVTPPPPDAAVLRQGGDTFADAFLITGEFFDTTGTTTGYTDDYDEVCPYANSTSPDVVYRFSPQYTTVVDIDLFGSDYDTKLYVYGGGMQLVACNDDFYPDYTSRIENLLLERGVKYYIVVDGYGGSHGQYVFSMGIIPPDQGEVACDPDWPVEGEPPLADGYVDAYNGGCTNLDQGLHLLDFQFDAIYCARSGWFEGGRDHDWYRGNAIDIYGSFEVAAQVEYATWMVVYAGADCGNLETRGSLLIVPPDEGYLWVGASGNEEMWVEVYPQFEVAPPGFEGHEYDYVIMQLFPVGEPAIRVEGHSWTAVKGLFD